MKNLFITFEGIDGSGKDTQMINLINFLKEKNKYLNIWTTREPTNLTNEGIKISEFLKSSKKIIDKKITTNLYVKDRLKHTKLIKNYLKNSFVLCSRYDFSTFTYQNVQGYDIEKLYELHKYNKKDGCIIPDLTIVFLIDEKTSLNRVKKRKNQKEFFEKEEFLKEVLKVQKETIKFLEKKDKRKIITINANCDIEKVRKDLIKKVSKFLV